MRIGIVGCGLIGQKRAAAAKGHEVLLVTDLDAGRAQALADKTGATVSKDWQALVAADIDVVIIATAPQHATRLWPDMSARYDFEPIATVYLQFDRHTRLDFPLLNLDGPFGQWVVDRGDGLLACVLSGHGDWERLDDAGLATALQGELQLDGQAAWYKVIREKRATFSCRPQLPRPGQQTAERGLWLAGDYTWGDYPATLEGAVRSGVAAARGLLD